MNRRVFIGETNIELSIIVLHFLHGRTIIIIITVARQRIRVTYKYDQITRYTHDDGNYQLGA